MTLTSAVRDKIARILKAVAEERPLDLEPAVDAIVGLLPDDHRGKPFIWCVREPGLDLTFAKAAFFSDAASACVYFNSLPKDGPPKELVEIRETIVGQWPSDQPPGERT
jgi:hypothetical protein